MASNQSRGERLLKKQLESIAPNIEDHYTSFKLNTPYLVEKTRCQHTFQIALSRKAIEFVRANVSRDQLTIVDIGDSSGTHLLCLKTLFESERLLLRCVSVNLDPVAVKKIAAKGVEAMLCRAEDFANNGIDADIFFLFQTLEHLLDPISFLHTLSKSPTCNCLVLTVPYVKKSRVGLQFIRKETKISPTAENTHIFEFCPEDWILLAKFSGWKPIYTDLYTQYPRWTPLRLTQPMWEIFDFPGFFGMILTKEAQFADQYSDWPQHLPNNPK